jgi:tRNA pseudouridine38-40 synthase
MERYQVILAYDGTDFLGFQRQGKGRTVQGVVEAALRPLGWQGRTILAAGRTDAGVHASGQVIAFDLEWPHPPGNLLRALNARLPADVAVRLVKPVSPHFHPCYDAAARRYGYRLFCQPERHPLWERYAWRVWPPAALEPMQRAAADLIGRHDFAAFGAPPRVRGTTIRTVFEAGWQLEGAGLIFAISANAFLYHMVRRLVSLQVAIGQGFCDLQEVQQHLLNPKNGIVQGLAPPHGLELVEVTYPAVVSEDKLEKEVEIGEDDRAEELLS